MRNIWLSFGGVCTTSSYVNLFIFTKSYCFTAVWLKDKLISDPFCRICLWSLYGLVFDLNVSDSEIHLLALNCKFWSCMSLWLCYFRCKVICHVFIYVTVFTLMGCITVYLVTSNIWKSPWKSQFFSSKGS